LITSAPTIDELSAFAERVAYHLGLAIALDSRELGELLVERVRGARCGSIETYLTRPVTSDEIAAWARGLTVSETYFFRNPAQLQALASIMQSRGARATRLLSAGCASGEEAYSLAMIAREHAPIAVARGQVEIVGVDVSPNAIARARDASYSAWSLRDMPGAMRERYLGAVGARWQVEPAARALVRFEERNLSADDPTFWRAEAFDVIFCRNVLMYFTPEAAAQAIARIARALAPDGWLFLGHAETLRGIGRALPEPVGLELTPIGQAFAYRRSAARDVGLAIPWPESEPITTAGTGWVEAIAGAHARVVELAGGAVRGPVVAAAPSDADATIDPEVRDLVRRERFVEALERLPEGRALTPASRVVRAALLVHTGAFAAAEAACADLVAGHTREPAALYLAGLCRERALDLQGAIACHRAAVALDPAFAMPRLHLGLIARRLGRGEDARRELTVAAELLALEDEARVELFGGGFGRAALVAMCRTGGGA